MTGPESRLTGPIFGSLVAVICFVIGKYLIPEQHAALRSLFILFGGVALLFALFGWLDWFVDRFTVHLKAARQAWYGPTEYYRDLAREIRLMNSRQLRIFEHIGPLEIRGYLKGKTVYYSFHTSTIDIPYTFIGEYLGKCGPIYPDLKTQHGIPDNLRRDYIAAFTREMVANGLADPPQGNRPAVWKVPFSEILDLFGMGE